MGWVIAATILFLLAVMPLGASLSFDSCGAIVKIIAGPIRITLFPRKKKEKKTAKKSFRKQKADAQSTKSVKNTMENPSQTGGSWKDFLPLVQVLLDTLNRFRRKLRVNSLELKVILAGDDPCDLGIHYGRVWAAVSNLLSALDSVFVIKKQDARVECDFTADKTLVIARLDLTITLGRLLSLAAVAAVKGLREYKSIYRKRKAVS